MGTDDKELFDESFEALGSGQQKLEEAERRAFEQLADRVEEPGLQDRILQRYLDYGQNLLGDRLPSHLDPRIAKRLEPMLGDVSNVRVHSGPMASAAAQAMNARAFALGDGDIFIDRAQFDPHSREGGALIAHEVAHTRDAATGFALSAKSGMHTSDREEFAHQVERFYAAEWDDDGDGDDAVRSDEEPAKQAGADGMPKEPEVDKRVLEDKIVALLEKQDRLQRDRYGL